MVQAPPHQAVRPLPTTRFRFSRKGAEMALHLPSRPAAPARPGAAAAGPGPSPAAAVRWLAGGALLAFTTSLVGTTLLGLQHDLFYLVYFTLALGYLGWFLSRSGFAWREVLRRNLWWSVAVGVLVGLAVVRQVLGQAGTPHPDGAYFGFELVWRGLVYGTVDALTLYVFPAVVAYLVLRGDRRGAARKLAFAGLVVVLSLGISASYHAGYSTYRGEEMAKPLIGTALMDAPAILTGNPLGSVVAHAAVHTTAVVHQYEGGENHFLPPELTSDYPDRPGGWAASALAAGWLALLGAVVVLNRQRLRKAWGHEA